MMLRAGQFESDVQTKRNHSWWRERARRLGQVLGPGRWWPAPQRSPFRAETDAKGSSALDGKPGERTKAKIRRLAIWAGVAVAYVAAGEAGLAMVTGSRIGSPVSP